MDIRCTEYTAEYLLEHTSQEKDNLLFIFPYHLNTNQNMEKYANF